MCLFPKCHLDLPECVGCNLVSVIRSFSLISINPGSVSAVTEQKERGVNPRARLQMHSARYETVSVQQI